MKLLSIAKQRNHHNRFPGGIRSGHIFILALLASICLHLTSYVKILPFSQLSHKSSHKQKSTVKLRLVPKRNDPLEPQTPKRIVETKQTKTKSPKESLLLGRNDHIAKEETVIKAPHRRKKGQELTAKNHAANIQAKPGQHPKVGQLQQNHAGKNPPRSDQRQLPASHIKISRPKVSDGGLVPIPAEPIVRNNYERLLGASLPMIAKEIDAGYQDFVDLKLRTADVIDLSTTQYKFISYFSKVRKAIELAWVYPSKAARKGIDGSVLVSFTIDRRGKVSRIAVKDSSGDGNLDSAIVEAIELASPFAPLPQTLKKPYLDITGTFNYVLTHY